MEGAGVEGGFQRYPPPSKAGSTEEAEGCQKQVYENTFTLEEFPGWAPWSWLLPWRVGPKSNNLETQAGITDFHVFLLTLGRPAITVHNTPGNSSAWASTSEMNRRVEEGPSG